MFNHLFCAIWIEGWKTQCFSFSERLQNPALSGCFATGRSDMPHLQGTQGAMVNWPERAPYCGHPFTPHGKSGHVTPQFSRAGGNSCPWQGILRAGCLGEGRGRLLRSHYSSAPRWTWPNAPGSITEPQNRSVAEPQSHGTAESRNCSITEPQLCSLCPATSPCADASGPGGDPGDPAQHLPSKHGAAPGTGTIPAQGKAEEELPDANGS